MTIRRTGRVGRAMAAAALTTGLVLTGVGCGGGGDDDSADESKGSSATPSQKGGGGTSGGADDSTASGSKTLARVEGGGGIVLTINEAVRDTGGFVTVTGQVENGTGKVWNAPGWQGSELELAKNQASLAGASLIDKQSKKKFLILRDTEGRCLCTTFGVALQPGDTREWFAQFPAPPATSSQVDFQIADMPPATVELSQGE